MVEVFLNMIRTAQNKQEFMAKVHDFDIKYERSHKDLPQKILSRTANNAADQCKNCQQPIWDLRTHSKHPHKTLNLSGKLLDKPNNTHQAKAAFIKQVILQCSHKYFPIWCLSQQQRCSNHLNHERNKISIRSLQQGILKAQINLCRHFLRLW